MEASEVAPFGEVPLKEKIKGVGSDHIFPNPG